MGKRAISMLFLAAFGLFQPAAADDAPLSFEKAGLSIEAHGQAHPFTVELAQTPQQQAQGLMHRRSLARGHGMLFLFGAPRDVQMWMKNTEIPLDMLFIAQDGRILHIQHDATPNSLDIISAPQPSSAVLELAGGTAEAEHIKAGDRVIYPAFQQEKTP